MFEVVSRMFCSVNMLFDLIKAEDETSWRIKWIRNRKSVKQYYKFDIYDSIRGWALKPNISNLKVFDNKLLSSNSKGLRGKTEYSYKKNKDKTRILIIGDSFTFGEGVSDTETYSYYLQNMLPDAEIMNFGVHGYGNGQMLLYLEKEGMKYKPDIVVLGFVRDAILRNMINFRDYAKPKYVFVNNKLKLTNVPVPRPELILRRDFYSSRFFDLLWLSYRRYLRLGKPRRKMGKPLTTAILDTILKLTKKNGAVMLFAYLPTGDEIDKFKRIGPMEKYLRHYCRKRKAEYLSLRAGFVRGRRKDSNLSVRYTGHWRAKEHMIAAKEIKRYLLKDLLGKYPQKYKNNI